ncbi:hypothetical protein PISMIDRAFT_687581 [Pisolithus microcarpus 441]|uniref:Uncharacterized protein n=1 Tax=Pisolithus microcarpus 441 TaxID=765257 RepID=A0A0C9YEF7_9AGAM|nr:hypothetical protein PISMIDRAFT_687581 [Pisolithus microcarpus 441]
MQDSILYRGLDRSHKQITVMVTVAFRKISHLRQIASKIGATIGGTSRVEEWVWKK